MALVYYSHLPCRICMYKSVAIQYNHHGVVCQLLRQYRACVVDSVLWYIHRQACLLRAYISSVSMLSSTGQKRSVFRISYTMYNYTIILINLCTKA